MPHFAYPFISWWILGLFPLWGLKKIMCNAAMNICINFLCEHVFSTLGIYPGLELLSYDSYIFNFSRYSQTVFQSNCTILHSNQQRTWVPTSLHPPQHLLLNIFWEYSYPGDMSNTSLCFLFSFPWWYWALFLYLLVICISLKKYLFKNFAHFYLDYLPFITEFWGLYMLWLQLSY